jgi:threonine/homoserine/homoserine lactone efflux protein
LITADFLITSLIVVLTPGTGVVYTVSTGLFLGRRASVFASIGCTAGIVPHLLASILGLAAILHASAEAFNLVKFAGVAYLLYLAWVMWREKGMLTFDRSPSATGTRSIIVKAFAMNILNPKLSIFFLAFLPQFVSPSADSPVRQMLILSGVFMVMTFAVFVVYGAVAHGFRTVVMNSPRVQRWLRRSFAAAIAVLGINLALSER